MQPQKACSLVVGTCALTDRRLLALQIKSGLQWYMHGLEHISVSCIHALCTHANSDQAYNLVR